MVERHDRRVSGPLRDRIDLWVDMPRVAPATLVGPTESEGSAAVAARIAAARARATARSGGRPNGRLRGRALRLACRLDSEAERRVVDLAEVEAASGRGTERILRVARTIADLDGSSVVTAAYVDEAAFYRSSSMRAASALAS
jgi:magnesium chelatase family protein